MCHGRVRTPDSRRPLAQAVGNPPPAAAKVAVERPFPAWSFGRLPAAHGHAAVGVEIAPLAAVPSVEGLEGDDEASVLVLLGPDHPGRSTGRTAPAPRTRTTAGGLGSS